MVSEPCVRQLMHNGLHKVANPAPPRGLNDDAPFAVDADPVVLHAVEFVRVPVAYLPRLSVDFKGGYGFELHTRIGSGYTVNTLGQIFVNRPFTLGVHPSRDLLELSPALWTIMRGARGLAPRATMFFFLHALGYRAIPGEVWNLG